ncbi:MAG: YihY/virulence factor BrkB family protein [Alistipes sp.]|jgi:membrane protein|nr:YihY/virulence factor BrkB family protein [Alistipes sp.]
MIRNIIDFFSHGVWQSEATDLSGKRGWAVSQLRVIIFTARGFGRHDTAIRSAALSFFTVMSLVPILALVFVIFKGFGMEQSFNDYLYDLFPQYRALADQIVIFIGNLLNRTRGGVMAVGAFFVLIWAVIQVFGSVEAAFNKIWEVKRSRSFARRFPVYMALVIIVPIMLLAANSVYVGMRQRVELFTGSLGAEVLFGIAGVALVIVMFSLIYFVLPNTAVKYGNALKAGIVAGLGFSLFQVIYFFIQGNLSSYNAIYGTFAAIPLFLLWLQISWQILLFGGELSFAMQNIHDFVAEREAHDVSYDNRCKIMIAVMTIVIRNYLDGGGVSSPEQIAAEIGVPVRTAKDVANELEEDGMVLFVQGNATDKATLMAPARDPRSIRFFDVINSVTGHGGEMPHLRETPLMSRIDATYEKVKGDIGSSDDNISLVSLIS